ncbi:sugar phosphate isomerase/epimerase family protein [Microbacterium capsulatum]|uniref:Sugar phosphate isomerase/epimerase family protein n=1 Tax=Microbacterium capsulatum TaxID=3041921 RepID=A0ABU0XEN8_9MICO|nr:sugar phosphate isomerase/epimerase family protein [Microbacterium sp. ASV81]MDQ4213581.1 sugar phosphate isomerase/epimerase family protein [Microbacterium sp. ASV81]
MLDRTQGIEPGAWQEALDVARDAGLDGVLFAHSRTVSPDLDGGELRAAGQAFADAGLFVEVGVGELGPSGEDADRIADLTASLRAAADLGARQIFGFTRTVRDPGLTRHRAQMDLIAGRLAQLRPVLEDAGQILNVKTHEDLSSHQVLELVERAGPDRYAVSLDVANLVVRGEDPVEAARRLAPHIRQTHLEDVVLFFIEQGLRRRLRPVGDGILDWAALLDVLATTPATTLVIEQHLGRFDADIFEDEWLAGEPHLAVAELTRLVAGAVRTEAAAREGRGPSLADLDPETTIAERRADLRRGITRLRELADAQKEAAA